MNFEKNWFTDTAYITEKRKNIKNRQFELLEENLNQKFELHSLTKKLFDIETLYKIGEKVIRNKNCKTIKIRNLNLTFEKISNLNMWFSI